MNYTFERFHHLAVLSSKFGEGPCLILKDCGEGLDRITTLEVPSERMFNQSHPCLLFIALQGCLEERPKHGARWVTHITGRRNMAISGGNCSVRGNERGDRVEGAYRYFSHTSRVKKSNSKLGESDRADEAGLLVPLV
jgi:hypothetical protein